MRDTLRRNSERTDAAARKAREQDAGGPPDDDGPGSAIATERGIHARIVSIVAERRSCHFWQGSQLVHPYTREMAVKMAEIDATKTPKSLFYG